MRAVIETLEVRALLTVLTFDGVTVPGTPISQAYGDRVTTAGTGGATPNVTVTYGPVGTQAFTWETGYGDLTNVLYPGAAAGGFLDVKLTADLGFLAQLTSIDLAGKGGRDFTIKSIQALDGRDQVLFTQNDVLVHGDGTGPAHTMVPFGSVASGRVVRLRIDASNLPAADQDQIAIDNIQFSQAVGASASGDGFADLVMGFIDSGAGPVRGPYGGDHSDVSAKPVSLGVVLGEDPTEDVNYLSLAKNSSVTVAFADEVVKDGFGTDLVVRELVDNDEVAKVYVSSDFVNFAFLGTAQAGRSNKFDLAAVGFTGNVRAVRIIGQDTSGASPGFDLVSVQAMTSSMHAADATAQGLPFATIGANGVISAGGTGGHDQMALSTAIGMIDVTRNGVTMAFNASITRGINVDLGAGNDYITVGPGVMSTYLFGGTGDDILSGGDGNDTLSGAAGKNKLYGNAGKDRLNGSGSRDYLEGGNGDDRLYGNAGNDTLVGTAHVDRLFAGDGADLLYGGSSNDKLYGEAGDDTLIGNGQADLLDGGAGTDTAFRDALDLTPVSVEVLK
jgi:Ca2+-binding RTX toxin-like protein